jgi:hypothetical protein
MNDPQINIGGNVPCQPPLSRTYISQDFGFHWLGGIALQVSVLIVLRLIQHSSADILGQAHAIILL